MEKDSIKLPVNKDNKPDFEYMEKYIQTIKAMAEESLQNLEIALDK